ncbi:MAG: hypothetical protein QJR09_08045 [Micrococcus sp.]|nr:hypothetical protein [Micrococcus sp.]
MDDALIPVLPGQMDALALLSPGPAPVGAAGQCLDPVTLPGFDAIGLPYIRCWRPLPCPDHDKED